MPTLADYGAAVSTSPGPTLTATPVPVNRAGHGAAAWGGSVLLAGGNLVTTTTNLYDYTSDTWSSGPALAGGKGWVGACQVGSVLHLIGGVQSGAGTPFSLDHVYADLANLSSGWQGGTILPAGRSYHATVWDGTNIRILGGRLGSPSTPSAPAADHFDLAGNTYASMPVARYDHAAIWHQGMLYVFGGLNASGNSLNDAYVYNPGTNTWMAIANLWGLRGRMKAYSDGTFIHLIGGYFKSSSAGPFSESEWYIYDPTTDTYAGSGIPQPSYWVGVVPGPSAHRPIAFFGGTDSAAHSFIQTQTGALALPAPSITLVSITPTSANVGQLVTVQATIECHGANPVDWTIDWGEFNPSTGVNFSTTGTASSDGTLLVSHSYQTSNNPNPYVIGWRTVEHEPPLRTTGPTALATISIAVTPGATGSLSATDVNVGDPVTLTVNVAMNGCDVVLGHLFFGEDLVPDEHHADGERNTSRFDDPVFTTEWTYQTPGTYDVSVHLLNADDYFGLDAWTDLADRIVRVLIGTVTVGTPPPPPPPDPALTGNLTRTRSAFI